MTLEERFEIFWKAYPRKVGKGACRKIWKRKKYDEETLDQMLETLKWQMNLKQWQKRICATPKHMVKSKNVGKMN